jgi:methanethiol S-methyltransferase
LGAFLVGGILGAICSPTASDWEQTQTDLSTTVAAAAASGVAVWAAAKWWVEGTPPGFATFLPLWFIVQYAGHCFAALLNRTKWAPGRDKVLPVPPAGQTPVESNTTEGRAA